MNNVSLTIAEMTRRGGEKVYFGKFPLTGTINVYLESTDRNEMLMAADTLLTLINNVQEPPKGILH